MIFNGFIVFSSCAFETHLMNQHIKSEALLNRFIVVDGGAFETQLMNLHLKVLKKIFVDPFTKGLPRKVVLDMSKGMNLKP